MRGFFKGFQNAFSGIIQSVKLGRNVRIQMVAGVYALLISPFFVKSRAEAGAVLLTVAMVLSAEIFNTALERLCDITEPSFNRLIKSAKDIAAGAVLVCAVFSVFVAAVLFTRPVYFHSFLQFCGAHLWYPIGLVLLMIPGIWFIVGIKRR